MKRFIVVFVAIQVIVMCTSCGNYYWGPRKLGSGRSYTDKFLNALLEDSEKGDLALEDMFSKTLKDNNDNLSSDIKTLKSLLVGKNVVWKSNGGGTDKSVNHEKVQEKVLYGYFITVDSVEYYLVVAAYTRDTENIDNIGVYSLYFNTRQQEDTEYSKWYKEKPFGIYSPLF